MALTHLWLSDFRCFEKAEIQPSDDVTVILGPNGSGKTSVLEAIGLLATMRSFRTSSRDALVRKGSDTAYARAEVRKNDRLVLLEAAIPLGRSARIQVNRQPTKRIADLSGSLRVSVFSPEDLELVQGPPSQRRDFLDQCLTAGDPGMEALVTEVDRILRHRAALLRNVATRRGGRGDTSDTSDTSDTDKPPPHGTARMQEQTAGRGDVDSSFDVWDDRLARAGTRLAESREMLVQALTPLATSGYRRLADSDAFLTLEYNRSWNGDLRDALESGRDDDIKHQATRSGPHRDELSIELNGLPARTHASQGEQRCVALALRLAAHELATSRSGEAPVLLLDDVFSELDDKRAAALAECLPRGQILLATAVGPPPALKGSIVDIADIATGAKTS